MTKFEITLHDLFWHFFGAIVSFFVLYFIIGQDLFFCNVVVFTGGLLIEIYDKIYNEGFSFSDMFLVLLALIVTNLLLYFL